MSDVIAARAGGIPGKPQVPKAPLLSGLPLCVVVTLFLPIVLLLTPVFLVGVAVVVEGSWLGTAVRGLVGRRSGKGL